VIISSLEILEDNSSRPWPFFWGLNWCEKRFKSPKIWRNHRFFTLWQFCSFHDSQSPGDRTESHISLLTPHFFLGQKCGRLPMFVSEPLLLDVIRSQANRLFPAILLSLSSREPTFTEWHFRKVEAISIHFRLPSRLDQTTQEFGIHSITKGQARFINRLWFFPGKRDSRLESLRSTHSRWLRLIHATDGNIFRLSPKNCVIPSWLFPCAITSCSHTPVHCMGISGFVPIDCFCPRE
jgi:hypothetical protein